MNINIIMNSISDAHSNKRIKDFENQGFNINIFGFNRGIVSPERKKQLNENLMTITLYLVLK